MRAARICALNIFREKGEPGTSAEEVQVKKGGGIPGDMHCCDRERQISILTEEAYGWMQEQEVTGLCFRSIKANLVVADLPGCLEAGMRLGAGQAVLRITGQKECFDECERRKRGMPCVLRHGCWFAGAESDGAIHLGDKVEIRDRGCSGTPGSLEGYRWNRYKRQFLVPGMGKGQQELLRNASVLVVGAGGLGCPALTVLAEAGVGRIGIVDGDVVEETNLNRQFLYTPADIGKSKARSAGEWLLRFRPDMQVNVWESRLAEDNGLEIIEGFDLVIAAVDRVHTRLLINRLAFRCGKPLIDGAIDGYYGTVTAALLGDAPCLACLNPEEKEPGHESGSLGTTTMITGALQAQFALRFLAGLPVESGYVLSYDGLHGTLDEIPAVKNVDCPICGMAEEKRGIYDKKIT